MKKMLILMVALITGITMAFADDSETKTRKENHGSEKSEYVNKGKQGERIRERTRIRREEKKEMKNEVKEMKREAKKTRKEAKEARKSK